MVLTVNEFRQVFQAWAAVMKKNRDRLIDLDSIVGDGDLGLTMSDGFAAASTYADGYTGTDLGNFFYFSGKAMATAVPSSMGTLMASGLLEVGKRLKGKTEIDMTQAGDVLAAFTEGVALRGRAKQGEKTVLDSLIPAVNVLKFSDHNTDIALLLDQAAKAAEQGAQDTIGMLAMHGRAAGRGEQSRELLDPGAVVGALLVKSMVESFHHFTV